jgi:1,4-dihydroxy-2-naphthoate octaprenyltransferase
LAGRSPSGNRVGLFVRFARVQFVPVILAPILVGAAAAFETSRSVNLVYLALLLLGAAFLHIASNSIDDVYDFLNGVDGVSESMFPKEFPGWKPIPRGMLSVSQAFTISFVFYSLSLAIGVYLSVVVGWIALAIAVPGVLLSYFYVAPPLKLDYRGFGLGELSIFLGFGPIPALGAFYVLTGTLRVLPLLVSIPCGLLTMNVLLTHDMIFLDPYKATGKRSLTIVLGRVRTEWLTLGSAVAAYLVVIALVVLKTIPTTALLVLLAVPLLLRTGLPPKNERSVPDYAGRTKILFLHSLAFSLLFAAGLVL